jgi:glycerol-3-phosphate dehydrogenase
LERLVKTIEEDVFDVIVIGGGIIGSGIARDASLRGFSTLLVEKEDFGYGTTSRSTRLIHGGLRYLSQFQFKLVQEDLREREILLRIAPHLVHTLPFIIPLLASQWQYRISLPFGLWLYDLLARNKSLPSCQKLSLQETLEKESSLRKVKGLIGSYLYYDCQAEYMERLCIENVISATENGAKAFNHVIMTSLLVKDGIANGVEVQDTLSGERYRAKGKFVINATGPWADIVWDNLALSKKRTLRCTKGVHILTGKLSNSALVLFAKSDRRLFFVIPWGNYSLIGTTDTDYVGDPDNVFATLEDVEYLVAELRHYFPDFKKENIAYTQAGLRPLIAVGHKSASNTPRAHKVIDHEKTQKVRGLISVLGGKSTAYRLIAMEVVDLVTKKMGSISRCTTADVPLPGASVVNEHEIEKASRQSGISAETMKHLARIYGSRYNDILDITRVQPGLNRQIHPSYLDIVAQIKHAIKKEFACSVSDFLMRRSVMGLQPGQGVEAVKTVAEEMGRILDWNITKQKEQVDGYCAFVKLEREALTSSIYL